MKQTIRLTESEFRTMVQETVNEVLNKSNSVFYNDRPSRITKMDRSNSSKKHTLSPDEIEKLHNILNGEETKQSVRVSEAQLHQIIRETVETVINEAYSDAQYAHLAGQANGALKSFGGRLKGMFNPKWKNRKERQMRNFANQATNQNFDYEKSSTKGGDHNDGNAAYRMPDHNYTWSNGGQVDYIANSFNQKNSKSPFEMKRQQSYVTVDDPSKPNSGRSYRAMANDGDVYSRGETKGIANQHADKKEWDRYSEMEKLRDSNSMLNNAFQQGQQARKGKTYKTGGGTYNNGTGTSSSSFKRLK